MDDIVKQVQAILNEAGKSKGEVVEFRGVTGGRPRLRKLHARIDAWVAELGVSEDEIIEALGCYLQVHQRIKEVG